MICKSTSCWFCLQGRSLSRANSSNHVGYVSDPSSPLPISQRPQGLLSPTVSGVLSPRAGEQTLDRIASPFIAQGLESRPSEIEPAKAQPGDKPVPHRNRVQALQDRVKLLEKELVDIESTNKLRWAILCPSCCLVSLPRLQVLHTWHPVWRKIPKRIVVGHICNVCEALVLVNAVSEKDYHSTASLFDSCQVCKNAQGMYFLVSRYLPSWIRLAIC